MLYLNAATLLAQLNRQILARSGLEVRAYLGMSSIGQCPRKLYFDLIQGRAFTARDARYCYVGYLFERDLKVRLAEIGVYAADSECELIAPWDTRFRGHTDGATTEGHLLELKSINDKGFRLVSDTQQPKREHLCQIQTYLKYGHMSQALAMYVNRDTFEHTAFAVAYDPQLADAMEHKAMVILKAVDTHTPPRCECNYCRT